MEKLNKKEKTIILLNAIALVVFIFFGIELFNEPSTFLNVLGVVNIFVLILWTNKSFKIIKSKENEEH